MNIKKNYWIGKHGPMMIAEIGANHEEILVALKN